MNITIYTLTYNEELLIQLMIDHYRFRFSNCKIIIYDNQSTDRTVEIAKNNNCEIRYYSTGGELNDQISLDIKNSCWKDSETDWVLVCDLDEMLDINEQQLIEEDKRGATKIKSEYWHMVNMENNLDIRSICYGFRDPNNTVYDKDLLFNKKFVDIKYRRDAHFTDSIGHIVYGSKQYKMYHFKYINPDLFVAKNKLNVQRLSYVNKINNWSASCFRDEEALKAEFQNVRNNAVKILP
jgi:glycosyltransferase involved in cell wall biosynthesis